MFKMKVSACLLLLHVCWLRNNVAAQDMVPLDHLSSNFLKYYADSFSHFLRKKRSIEDRDDFVFKRDNPEVKPTHIDHPPPLPAATARTPKTTLAPVATEPLPPAVGNSPWAKFRKSREGNDDAAPRASPPALADPPTQRPEPIVTTDSPAPQPVPNPNRLKQDGSEQLSNKHDAPNELTADQIKALHRAGFSMDHFELRSNNDRNVDRYERRRREIEEKRTSELERNKLKREIAENQKELQKLRIMAHNNQESVINRIERKVDNLDILPTVRKHHLPLPPTTKPDSGLVFFNAGDEEKLTDFGGPRRKVSQHSSKTKEESPPRKKRDDEGKGDKSSSGSSDLPYMSVPFGYAATPGLVSSLFPNTPPMNPAFYPNQASWGGPGRPSPLAYQAQALLLPELNQNVGSGVFPKPPALGILSPPQLARQIMATMDAPTAPFTPQLSPYAQPFPQPPVQYGSNGLPIPPFGYYHMPSPNVTGSTPIEYLNPIPQFVNPSILFPNVTAMLPPEPLKNNPYSAVTHVAVIPGLRDTGIYKVLTKHDSLVPIAGNTRPTLGHFVHKLAPRANANYRRRYPNTGLIRRFRHFTPRISGGIPMPEPPKPPLVPTYHNIPLSFLYAQPHPAGPISPSFQNSVQYPYNPNVPHHLYPGIPNPTWTQGLQENKEKGANEKEEKKTDKKEETKKEKKEATKKETKSEAAPAAKASKKKKRASERTPGPVLALRIVEPSPSEVKDYQGNKMLARLIPRP